MRAHYNSATCNAKPLCLSAIVNVFAGPFCFFFSRGHVLFARGVATRKYGDSVTKPSLSLRAFYFENIRALYFPTVSHDEKNPRKLLAVVEYTCASRYLKSQHLAREKYVTGVSYIKANSLDWRV